MSWRDGFAAQLLTRAVTTWKRATRSNVPGKIIATVLLAIFVPSLLITALGLFAIYRAELTVRRQAELPVRSVLERLKDRLAREWTVRHRRYDSRLGIRTNLDRYLRSLPITDTHVAEVFVLRADGSHEDISPRSPLWALDAPFATPALRQAWETEFQTGDLEAARELYDRLSDEAAPEVAVEALQGLARVQNGLGDWRGSVRTLERLVDRFGLSTDFTGMPRGLPALLRIVELWRAHDEPVHAILNVDKLQRFIHRIEPWLDEEILDHYAGRLRSEQRELGDRFDEIPRGKTPIGSHTASLGAEMMGRLSDHARRLGIEPRRGHVYIESDTGRGYQFAFFRVAAIDAIVYLQLVPEAHFADVGLFSKELGLRKELLGFIAPSGDLLVKPQKPHEEVLVTTPMPRPLERYSLQYYPAPDETPLALQRLETLKNTGIAWAIIVLVLTTALGIMVTLRSVLQEMQVARLKSDFVSFITHELKTPLTAIRMFTETLLLGRTGGPEDERKCVELIDKEAVRLSRLIQSVLQFSSIERSRACFNFEPCELTEVVDEAVKIFREHRPDKDVDIEVHQAQHISRLRLDRASIIEALLNLLSNAYKYSRGDQKKIVINLRESIDHVSVEVIDNGIGIPKREQRKIFDQFYRAQDYLTRDIDGTGLGLSFARYVARVHNGDIKVSSVVRHGSTFTLELQKNQVLAE